MWLTAYALKHPIHLTLVFSAVALFGAIGYFSMGQNILPSITFPFVSVSAPYSGASPEEIERLVIKPIEDQLQSVSHIDRINATALDGSGTIGVRFKLGSQSDTALNDVQHAVDAARDTLPPDLLPPTVAKNDPASAPIMQIAVFGPGMEPVALSDVVQNHVEPALRAVPGVGIVRIAGQYDPQIQVEPDVGRLGSVAATVLDVANSVAVSNRSLPGGRIDEPAVESTVGVRADATNGSRIGRAQLRYPGSTRSVTIGDVATVRDGFKDRRILSFVDGRTAILLFVSRDADADTASATRNIRAALQKLTEANPGIETREIQADVRYTTASIDGVLENLFEGIFLTALVLLIFLRSVRSATVVAVAIPSSLFATFAMMWLLGFTVNVLSLMGLSLTIGILVDDSIVVIDNILRHRALGKDPVSAAIEGRSEIGGAAVAITLVDVVVFAPIALMAGIIGQFMREFGLVVVVATLFSLFVSFTLTPVLTAGWVLRDDRDGARPRRLPWLLRAGLWPRVREFVASLGRRLADGFDRVRLAYAGVLLPMALHRPKVVAVACAAAMLVSFVPLLTGAIPSEFQPASASGQIDVTLSYAPGTPIAVTTAGALRLSAAVDALAGVHHTVVTVGRGLVGGIDILGGHIAELFVTLDDDQRRRQYATASQLLLLDALVPGARIAVNGIAMGGTSPIAYSIAGPDDLLDAAAGKIASVMAAIPQAANVATSSIESGPRMEIDVDPARAAMLGVTADDAAATARAAIAGVVATKVRAATGLVDAVVRLPADVRNDPSRLPSLNVRASDGRLVPLGDVADVRWMKEPPLIQRENRERIVQVTASTVGGAPVGPVTQTVDRALHSPGFLPPGVTVIPRGDVEQMQSLGSAVGVALLTSFALVYVLLVALFRSYRLPFVILISVPLASIGSFGVLWLENALHAVFPDANFFSGQTLNLYSMLGLLMLMGLVAKNGILLVDYANTMRSAGLSAVEAIRAAASARFRPIVMTTLAMIAGMLPLALGFTAGAEIRKAMGSVIIGGLASSLVLTLFLVPIAYVALTRSNARRA